MRVVFPLSLTLLCLVTAAFGQLPVEPTAIDYDTVRLSRIVRAVPTEEAMSIDGFLDEESWQTATPATDLIQSGSSRNPGQPLSERTEVRFLYDSENLYVGAICFDSNIDTMVVNGMMRDFPGRLSDEFGFIIDSLNDDRTGFFFTTNPTGAKADIQTSNDSQYNDDWDAVWDVRVHIGEDRWVAEFVVPFKTLRFSNAPTQEWGLNINRDIRRTNEDGHWAPIPRRYNTSRVSMAGTLTGLEGVRQGRNLKVTPYGKAGFTQQQVGNSLETDTDFNGGFDAKYGLTQSLTLDITFRTDFSQAEVDQDQVNLTRFNLFFPEKREFFLENAGVFAFGSRQASTLGRGGGENLIPFFSRRIGLGPAGSPIPIVGGTRVSGTAGRYEVGLLAMKTEREGPVPSNNFLVGRVKRNLLENSFVGAIVTSRDSSVAGDTNRVYGADAVFQFYNKLDVSGYILKSDTPTSSGNDRAGKFAVGWREDDWNITANYAKVEDLFDPQMGFVRREDNSHYWGSFSLQPRTESSDLVRNLTFRTNYDYWSDVAGEIETREHDLTAGLAFEDGASLNFTTTESFERLEAEFTRYSIPLGDYKFRDYAITYASDRSRKVGGRVNFRQGDFWNGTRKSVGGELTLRPDYHWQVDTTFSRDDIEVPAGSFPTTLVGLKILYAHSSRSFLNTFLQYNAERNQFSTNVRLNIIHHPLSEIFIVFNERRDTVTGEVVDRGVVFKFTNLFSF